ncbi:MAG: hypothetical protein ACI9WU_004224 [Myxococcota bacterium]
MLVSQRPHVDIHVGKFDRLIANPKRIHKEARACA